MKAKYNFMTLFIRDLVTCDNCGKTIHPRLDSGFKDLKYGIVFCLDCRTEYLKNLEEK